MEELLLRDPSIGAAFVDKRSGRDRRKRALVPPLFGRQHRRRRASGRRKTDQERYVDVYDLRSWSIALSVLILSFFDAIITGLHVLRGTAREANPILNAVLEKGGIPAFFSVKAMMTALPLAIIMLHKEWKLGRYAAWLCLCSYLLVALYHLYLVWVLK